MTGCHNCGDDRSSAVLGAYRYDSGHWREARLVVTASSLEHIDPKTGKNALKPLFISI